MRLAHWYHLWAAGEWREPLSEHLTALDDAGFDGPLYWGAVGPGSEIAEATDRIGHPPVVSAPEGFEQVTIHAVGEYAKSHPGAVMYCHSKGASGEKEPNKSLWRECMTRQVVTDWRVNLAALESFQAVGCMWITEDRFPRIALHAPFFAGNYWLARCDYLRTLPRCETGDRMRAEDWIGLGKPHVLDLLPGWPNEQTFRRGIG